MNESQRFNMVPAGYAELLETLKYRIRTAQTRAVLAANRELVQLYWEIGQHIVTRQQVEGWGTSVIQRLAADLQSEFPGIAGFSARNIWRMRAFYLAFRTEEILSQVATEIEDDTPPAEIADLPWFHNVLLIESVKDYKQRLWYAQMAREYGWSRSILALQIKADLFNRQGKALTNFQATLPPPQSDLAQKVLKDPYIFDFLTIGAETREKDIERQLMGHIRSFLLELGAGFAFLGQQYHLEVAGTDYYLDLLFYHTRLHCYVVIEIKSVEFKPTHAGQINFYLSAVDDLLRTPGDQPTIGLLLCKSKQSIVAEYALRDLGKPIGVADWETALVSHLPDTLRANLPSIEEIEAELQGMPFTGEERGDNED